ncbi:hypothetical protein AB0C29_43785 [Actinoplanes sp. NPDC048791]|uniref:hypothetical protein n=1 Tax=Actinoplanes sp. NPDC048791 TaxID=3154623 RepID=UPI0033FEEDDC
MSHPAVKVAGMTVGYLFSGLLGHLPLLAVLIAGFVLVAARRDRLSPRSMLFARLGLGALLLGSLLQFAWTMLIPVLYSSLDYSATQYGLVFGLIGLITALISAAGVGLLIAAVVTRGSAPGPGGQSFAGPPSQYGPGFEGSASPADQPYGNSPPGGQPYGNSPPGSQPYGNAPPDSQSHGHSPPGSQSHGGFHPGGQPFGTGDRRYESPFAG